MNKLISKELLPSKNNVFVWLNAVFLIVLLLIGIAEPLTVVMAYFLETIVIGVIYSVKLCNILSYKKNKSYKSIFNFLAGYLFFVAVQLIFVFAILKLDDKNIEASYYLITNLGYILQLKGMAYVLVSIVLYNLADYLINFLLPKIYQISQVNLVVKNPYFRILVQQFTVIIACFMCLIFPKAILFAILLIIIRTYLELYFYSISTRFKLKVKF